MAADDDDALGGALAALDQASALLHDYRVASEQATEAMRAAIKLLADNRDRIEVLERALSDAVTFADGVPFWADDADEWPGAAVRLANEWREILA